MLTPCSRFLLQRLRVLRLQAITRILRNPNFRYRGQNGPLLFPILCHMNPLHVLPSHSLKIHFNIMQPSTPRPSRQSHSCTLANQVPLRTSNCHAPLILRPICPPWYYYHKICGAEYKSLKFSLYSSLHRPVSSSSCTQSFSSAGSSRIPSVQVFHSVWKNKLTSLLKGEKP